MNKSGISKRFSEIPVGDQPICTEQEYRNMDPVWVTGPVPLRFWEHRENRRNYLVWLSYKLGCRKMKDIYRLTHEDVKRNRGGGLAGNYWRASLIAGVKECFPQYDWKEWLFVMAPAGFWKNKENHRRYMRWLCERLGIRRVEDWYRVTTEDFVNNAGGSFLLYYRSSVSRAVKAFLPKYDWKEWMFDRMPREFWNSRKNRQRYMRWLGGILGFKKLDDWYGVSFEDFVDNYGHELLKRYHETPALAVIDLIPRKHWHEWQFKRVPVGFWKKAENRRRYMRWLGKELGFSRPEDWYRLRWHDFSRHDGGAIMSELRSSMQLLREFMPEHAWDHWKSNTRLNDRLISRRAREFYAKNGRWPNRDTPGYIPGTRRTWHSINDFLKREKNRLRGRRTLASFIKAIGRKPSRFA